MLKYIEEFGKYVLITGFRNAKMEDATKLLKVVDKTEPRNVFIQFFDARSVATWQHLFFAVLNALKAFKNKANISRNFAIETIIYASAQRQIQKAMEKLGIKPETSELALIIVGDSSESVKSALSKILANTKMQLDEAVLMLTKEKVKMVQEKFEISDLELNTIMKENRLEEALTNLVIERMALLATQR